MRIVFTVPAASGHFHPLVPLARAGGKHELMTAWRRELPPPVMFVGDGATDPDQPWHEEQRAASADTFAESVWQASLSVSLTWVPTNSGPGMRARSSAR
mgnify:CR=1 FL=1